MKTPKRVIEYAKEHMSGVMHTTIDPDGPGVVRIHMIPPKVENDDLGASVVIINGQDIIPVNTSWSVLLSVFIEEVNKYSGVSVSEEDIGSIYKNVCKQMRHLYPFLLKSTIKRDIYTIMNTFVAIARGEKPDEAVDYISIADYAPYMRAPHRMDLLVSSMVKDGKWHCNQSCVHCYAAGQEMVSEPELSTEEWKQIIDKCRESLIPQLTFTGGEPTMREDLVELIDYSQWFVTRLNTNGIRLTEDLCQRLKAASLDSCQITFYSAKEEIHNSLVGAAQYSNTLNGIDNAIKAGLNISINTPLCVLNKDYVDTLKFLHERGVRYVTCSGLITTGNACNESSEVLQLSKEEITDILISAVEFCYANDMEISFTSPGWVDNAVFEKYGLPSPNCGACLSNMAVTPGGNAVACQSYLSGESMGNMLTDSWEDIWNSEECRRHRQYSARMTGLCPLRRCSHE